MPTGLLQAIVALAPYTVEVTNLIIELIEKLSDDELNELSEDDVAVFDTAVQKYRDSAARADAALDRLAMLIAAKKEGGG